MVRSQFIKTAFTFAAGTGVGFVANAKYHGQGKASEIRRVNCDYQWLIDNESSGLKSTKVDIEEITKF